MMLRTVWSANPANATRDVPAMGLAAQEDTQPSPGPWRAADSEARLVAAGSSPASPRSRAAAARPAARRRMGVRADDHDVMIYPPCAPRRLPQRVIRDVHQTAAGVQVRRFRADERSAELDALVPEVGDDFQPAAQRL